MNNEEKDALRGIIEVIQNNISHARSVRNRSVSKSQKDKHAGRQMAYETCLKMLQVEFSDNNENNNANNSQIDSDKEQHNS